MEPFPLPLLLPELQAEVAQRFDRLSHALFALTSPSLLALHEDAMLSPPRLVELAAEGGWFALCQFLFDWFLPRKAQDSDQPAGYFNSLREDGFHTAIRSGQVEFVRSFMKEYEDLVCRIAEHRVFESIGASPDHSAFKFLLDFLAGPGLPSSVFKQRSIEGMLRGALSFGSLFNLKSLLPLAPRKFNLLSPLLVCLPSANLGQVLRFLSESSPPMRERVKLALPGPFLSQGVTESVSLWLELGGQLPNSSADRHQLLREALSCRKLHVVQLLMNLGIKNDEPLDAEVGYLPDDLLDFLLSKQLLDPRRLLELSLQTQRIPRVLLSASVIDWCCRRLMKSAKEPCWEPPTQLLSGEELSYAHLVPYVAYTPGDKAAHLAQVQLDYNLPLYHRARLVRELVRRKLLPEKDHVLELALSHDYWRALRGLRKGGKLPDHGVIIQTFSLRRPKTCFVAPQIAEFRAEFSILDWLADIGSPVPVEDLMKWMLRAPLELCHSFFAFYETATRTPLDPGIARALVELNRSDIFELALHTASHVKLDELLQLALDRGSFLCVAAIVQRDKFLNPAKLWDYYKEHYTPLEPLNQLRVSFSHLEKRGLPFRLAGRILNLADPADLAEYLLSLTDVALRGFSIKIPDIHAQALFAELERLEPAAGAHAPRIQLIKELLQLPRAGQASNR